MTETMIATTARLARVVADAEDDLVVLDADPTVPFRVLLDRANEGNQHGDGLVVTIRGADQETVERPDLTPPMASVLIAQSTTGGDWIASQVLLNYALGWTVTQQLSWFRVEHGIIEVAVTASALRPPEPGQVDRILEAIGSALS